jgi:hypothetical protein
MRDGAVARFSIAALIGTFGVLLASTPATAVMPDIPGFTDEYRQTCHAEIEAEVAALRADYSEHHRDPDALIRGETNIRNGASHMHLEYIPLQTLHSITDQIGASEHLIADIDHRLSEPDPRDPTYLRFSRAHETTTICTYKILLAHLNRGGARRPSSPSPIPQSARPRAGAAKMAASAPATAPASTAAGVLPLSECKRQEAASDIGAKVRAVDRNDTVMLLRGAITGIDGLVRIYRQCLPDPGAKALIDGSLESRAGALETCRKVASDPAICDTPAFAIRPPPSQANTPLPSGRGTAALPSGRGTAPLASGQVTAADVQDSRAPRKVRTPPTKGPPPSAPPLESTVLIGDCLTPRIAAVRWYDERHLARVVTVEVRNTCQTQLWLEALMRVDGIGEFLTGYARPIWQNSHPPLLTGERWLWPQDVPLPHLNFPILREANGKMHLHVGAALTYDIVMAKPETIHLKLASCNRIARGAPGVSLFRDVPLNNVACVPWPK